jgi:hypothetical protein
MMIMIMIMMMIWIPVCQMMLMLMMIWFGISNTIECIDQTTCIGIEIDMRISFVIRCMKIKTYIIFINIISIIMMIVFIVVTNNSGIVVVVVDVGGGGGGGLSICVWCITQAIQGQLFVAWKNKLSTLG